jgi:hypothetical protein
MKILALLLASSLSLGSAAFGADSGILVRSGFTGLTPTANQTWVFNELDNRIYGYDNLGNWQQQTVGRIQSAGVGAPSSSNDSTQNYSTGSLWYDTIGLQWYICTNNTASSAVWSIFTGRVAQTDINNSIQPKLTVADAMSDFNVGSNGVAVFGGSLTGTTPAGVAYLGGLRISYPACTYTYTASRDTYDYLQTNGTFNHIAVANNATAPVGQPGLCIEKIVSNSVLISRAFIAPVAPITNVGTATPSTNNAINITQADSRYVATGNLTGPFTANFAMMSPNGSSGALVPRAIVSADLPIISMAQGGTGANISPSVNGVLYSANGVNLTTSVSPSAGLQYLRSNAANTALEFAATAGIGSLTITDSSGVYTYSPNPLTTSGTITGTLANQSANTALRGPASGSSATPTFRAAVAADCTVTAPAGGRLGTVSGQPLADGSGSGNTSIIYQPFISNILNIGGVNQTFGATSFSTSGWTAGTAYTLYCTSASSTTITISSSAWSSPTTPPTTFFLGSNAYLDSGHTQLILGGAYCTVSGEVFDVPARRHISNAANTVPRLLSAVDTTSSWTTTSTTFVAMDASTTDGVQRVSFFNFNVLPVEVRATQAGYNSSTTYDFLGLAFDSVTAADVKTPSFESATGASGYMFAEDAAELQGYHYCQKLQAVATGTGTFQGGSGGVGSAALGPTTGNNSTMTGEVQD